MNMAQPSNSDDVGPQQPSDGSKASGPRKLQTRPAPRTPQPVDTQIVDAYSQAMSNIAEAMLPVVVGVLPAQSSGEWFAPREAAASRSGAGSGVMISSDGYALTNSHVVMGQKKLSVLTSEGDRIDATVVGDDPSTDLAVLRVKGSGFAFARVLGEAGLASASGAGPVRVGQAVLAVGSPFGLSSTVSAGLVSAVGRSLRGQDGRLIEGVIQHTAPINPGNSGGPLLDARGSIVGINTAIIAMSQNVGFAISHEVVRSVVPQLLAHGAVRRMRLGVSITSVKLPRDVIRSLDVLNDSGVGVIEVEPRSLAAKAGVRAGDVIVGVGGAIVQTPDDLARALARFAPLPGKQGMGQGAEQHAVGFATPQELVLVLIRDGTTLVEQQVELSAQAT